MNTSISRAVEVLFFAAKEKRGTTLSNVANELGLSKSTAFHIVHTLIESGMLQVYDEKHLRFGIGFRAFELGLAYVDQNSFLDMAHQELEHLVSVLEMTANYLVCDDHRLTLIDTLPFQGSAYPNFAMGMQWKPTDLPMGLLCLPAWKDEEIIGCFGNGFAQLPGLLCQVQQARREGYLLQEITDHLATISVPVYDPEHTCIGVVCVYELCAKLGERDVPGIGGRLLESAERLSKQFGWSHTQRKKP